MSLGMKLKTSNLHLLLAGCCLFCASPVFATSITGTFSIRSTIEQFEDGQYKVSLRTFERYSQLEGRAVVEVETFDRNDGDIAHISYYHESHSDSWLRLRLHSCHLTNRSELESLTYGAALSSIWSPEITIEDLRTSHLVGTAYILRLVEQLRASLSQPQFEVVRNVEAVMLQGQVRSLNPAYSAARLQIFFGRGQLGREADASILPMQVVIDYERPQSTFSVHINFFSFEEIPEVDTFPDSQDTGRFSYPLSTGCSYALSQAPRDDRTFTAQLLSRVANLRKLYFKVKFTDTLNMEMKSSNEKHYFFAFDLERKLIRRDSYGGSSAFTSTTIYNYGLNKKFNLISESKESDPKHLSNVCVSADIGLNAQQPRLANFEKLQFMGRTSIDAQPVYIYEDAASNQLPGWLFPSVIIKSKAQSSVLLDPRGSLGHVYLIYYFVIDYEDKDTIKISRLLRIDIIVKDDQHHSTLYNARLDISEFSWTYSANTVKFGRSIFDFSDDCLKDLAGDDTRLDILMESKLAELTGRTLRDANEQLNERLTRDDHLSDMLADSLGVSPSQVIGLRSRIMNASIEATEKLPIIRVDLRISNLYYHLDKLHCNSLGKGRFFDKGILASMKVVTFEECAWFAHYQSLSANKEIAFVFSQRFECLIYRLQPQDAITNESSSSFFPYEHGQHVVYKLSLDKSDYPTRAHYKTKDLIGKKVKLSLSNSDDTLLYSIKQVRIIQAGGDRDKIEDRFENLSWEVDSNGAKTIEESVVSDDTGPQSVGVMTEVLCRSMCLLDRDCRSFSYCEPRNARQAECRLSDFDIRDREFVGQVEEELRGYKDLKMGNLRRFPVSTSGGTRLLLRHQKRCKLWSKSYVELFEKSHREARNISGLVELTNINTLEECAESCYDKNLNYLRGVLMQKFNLSKAEEHLRNVIDSQTTMEEVYSAIYWHSSHSGELCVGFYYCEDCTYPSENKHCILTSKTNATQAHTIVPGIKREQSHIDFVLMDSYKLVFTNMYQMMGGFKLANSDILRNGETEPRESELDRLKSFITFHQAGGNAQTMGLDHVESCARACTLQTYGPRPFCSSFDVVHQRNDGRTNIYCIFNSQSLNDLRRKGNLEGKLIYSNSSGDCYYWHYEPRETLIIPTNTDQDHRILELIERGNSLIEHRISRIKDQTNSNPLTVFHFFITLLGISSGLLLGSKLTTFCYNLKAGEADDPRFVDSVVRLVHRLSGVSLRKPLYEDEVMM